MEKKVVITLENKGKRKGYDTTIEGTGMTDIEIIGLLESIKINMINNRHTEIRKETQEDK